jgi:hypothetical protein
MRVKPANDVQALEFRLGRHLCQLLGRDLDAVALLHGAPQHVTPSNRRRTAAAGALVHADQQAHDLFAFGGERVRHHRSHSALGQRNGIIRRTSQS